ncbi:MAG: tetratricopeptide repeat protein [Leptolyngbya sp. DLM2.Bin27]|nr:MAG: tetratricopeptide repeat protein [Leptolyngbya sp. DLM2.Bin27]
MNAKLSFYCAVAAIALIANDLNAAADRLPATPTPAQIYSTEGLLYLQLGQWPQALASYRKALAEFRAADDLMGLGQTCCQLGVMMLQQNRYERARRWAEIALYSFTKVGRTDDNSSLVRIHYAAALHLLGTVNFHQGHYALAVKQFEKVLAIRYELHDQMGEALVMADLGRAYQAQAKYWYALACYEGALDICQPLEAALEGGWFEAKVRCLMARLCRACGHQDLAIKHHLEALALGAELGSSISP